ncbi:YeiH family protein [Paenibacillus sinopodophylli]|uniref:YeiH family protein n=1 Tax=Paenibacillus sinopodophylli TaxID=1837342 RepID=UPI00110CAD75|nr:YeiH family protein [Paenibacillus sinopodophylli]
MNTKSATTYPTYSGFSLSAGVGLTFLIAIAAKYVVLLPLFNIMGQMVVAILIGMVLRSWAIVPAVANSGIVFSSKRLLRVGIILLGMRLNLLDVIHAGPKVIVIAAVHVVFTIFVVYGLSKWLGIGSRLGLLTACGTAICGAAAVVALAPQLKANQNETAISAATVAILGTLFTIAYTALYPVLGLSAAGYGLFAGSTLHEIAHAVAAAAPGGQAAVDMSVMIKMTRVAMLIPVALVIGFWNSRKSGTNERMKLKSFPIPWFIVGFLAMSAIHTLDIIPAAITEQMIAAAYLLLAMAMAGLGLGVDIVWFKKLGKKPFVAGLIGSIMLAGLGFILIHLFHIAN